MDSKLLESKMLAYQHNPGKETFSDLLAYTDNQLANCVRALMSKYFFFACEDPEEIYQCCVMALLKASTSLKENTDTNYLNTRIFFYCRSECMSTFRKFYAEKCGCGCEFLENTDYFQYTVDEDKPLVFDDLINKLTNLVDDGLLCEENVKILLHVGMENWTYKRTGEVMNIPADKVSSRYKNTVAYLKTILNPEDFTWRE